MPRFTPQRYEQILPKLIARVVTEAGLTDVSDTSSVKHILAAVARAIDELYYQASLVLTFFSIDTATGADLDERAKEIQPGTLTRLQATPAVGAVVFSRSVVSGTVTIPVGTQVKTADGVTFATMALGTITPSSPGVLPGHTTGQDSNSVAAVAVTPGSNGNVAANTVTSFVNKPVGVDTVTNPGAFLQGTDQESDDSFRQRIKAFVASLPRCTAQALESGVLGVKDPMTGATILFSNVVEDPLNLGHVVLYIDDGTGEVESDHVVIGENVTAGLTGPPPNSAAGGEVRLFTANKPINTLTATFSLSSSIRGALTQGTHYTLNPANGQITFTPPLVVSEVITADYTNYTGLIQLAQKVVDGDPSDPTNYPGLRAAGVQVLVLAPQTVLITVVCTLTIAPAFSVTTVQANVVSAILSYINGLSIGQEVLRAALIQKIMETQGVVNVVLTTPSSDVLILDTQLPRTAVGDITVT